MGQHFVSYPKKLEILITVFFITPLSNDPQLAQKTDLLTRVFEGQNLCLKKADNYTHSVPPQISDMNYLIKGVDHYIVDLSHERPSCYFELGFIQSRNLSATVIAESGTQIHQMVNKDQVEFYNDLIEYQSIIESMVIEIQKNKYE